MLIPIWLKGEISKELVYEGPFNAVVNDRNSKIQKDLDFARHIIEFDPKIDLDFARHIIEFDPRNTLTYAHWTKIEPFLLQAKQVRWPSNLAPKPQPYSENPDSSDPLPEADYLLVTEHRTIYQLPAVRTKAALRAVPGIS
jgi:hypothetical protein